MGFLRRLRECTTCQNCTDSPCDPPAPVITSGGASGTVGVSFSYSITATNSPTSYAASGLPPGLSVNSTTGEIAGTPTTGGSYSVTIEAYNDCGGTFDTVTFNIDTPCVAPVITSANSAAGTEGTPFSFNVTASNSPTSYGASGTLPPGLSINTSTGEISGTPTTPGIYAFTVSASNACGTGSETLTITISPDECPMPTLKCDSIQNTRTKFGFVEFAGYESTPPKRYLTSTWAGSSRRLEYGESGCITLASDNSTYFAGSCNVDPSTGTSSGGFTVDGAGVGCGVNIAAYLACAALECAPTYTATIETFTGDATCRDGVRYTESAIETLSDEYTTTELIDDTVADLPSYPNTWDGDCQAIRDLTTDELTYSVQRFKYKFELPSMAGITSYQIDWLEGSTPRSYVWNGVDTETPVFTVGEPGSNGVIGISGVTVTCS